MRLGGEVEHRIHGVLGQQARDQRAIADVAVHEHVLRIVAQHRQRVQIAGVGELVQIDHAHAGLAQRCEHEVAADEAGAAGDEQGGHARESSRAAGDEPKEAHCASAAGDSTKASAPARINSARVP